MCSAKKQKKKTSAAGARREFIIDRTTTCSYVRFSAKSNSHYDTRRRIDETDDFYTRIYSKTYLYVYNLFGIQPRLRFALAIVPKRQHKTKTYGMNPKKCCRVNRRYYINRRELWTIDSRSKCVIRFEIDFFPLCSVRSVRAF